MTDQDLGRADVVDDATAPPAPPAGDVTDPAHPVDPVGDGAAEPAGRWRRARAVVTAALYPDPLHRPARSWSVVALGAVAAAVFALRLPWPATFTRVWAEDGATFLTEQARLGYPHALFTSYAGYMHAVPRTAAALVSLFPVADQAAALAVTTAVVVGALAALVHVVLRDLTGRGWAGVLAAAYFVLAPVGYETLGNLANLQWRLLPTALLVALWTPRRWWGAVVGALVLLATAASSPFGALALVVLVVRLVVRPSWTGAVFAAATAVGTAVQVVVALGAPDRPLKPVPGVRQLVDQYALRVLGDGVLGEQTVNRIDLGLATRVGQSLLVLVLALLLVAVVRGGRLVLLRVVGVGLIGLSSYVAPMVLSAPDFPDPSAARYYLAPAVLLVATLLVASGPSTATPTRWTPRSLGAAAGSAVRRWQHGPVAGLLPASVAFVLVMIGSGIGHYHLPSVQPYTPEISWQTGLAQARPACAANPAGEAAITINPIPGWTMYLPCSQLR